MTPLVKFKRLYPEAELPKWMTPRSIGADLHAFILNERGVPSKAIIPPCSTRNIGTGLAVEPPWVSDEDGGWVLSVWSRSGLAARSIFVANAPGLIDPDYRGEIKVLLYNGSAETQFIEHNQRIAQLVAVQMSWWTGIIVEELSETTRGENGFGSTGL